MKIIKLRPDAIIPARQTPHSAGMDLSVPLGEETIYIQPGETRLIKLGFATEFDHSLVGLVYARSGTALKKNLRPANCVPVIDADYRGEWMIALHNDHPTQVQFVNPGERIAQLVMAASNFHLNFVEVASLSDTQRGAGGFGSTG